MRFALVLSLVFCLALCPARTEAGLFKIEPATTTLGKCRNALARLVRYGGGALVLVTALIWVGTDPYHSVNAYRQGKTHIGYAIYLDLDQIAQRLGVTSSELQEKADADPVKTAKWLSSSLHGGYEQAVANRKIASFLPAPRDASEYYDASRGDRGICRHKACVLAATLGNLGIRAEVEILETNQRQEYGVGPFVSEKSVLHNIVVLPDYDLALDPTNNESGPVQVIRERNGVPVGIAEVPSGLNY